MKTCSPAWTSSSSGPGGRGTPGVIVSITMPRPPLRNRLEVGQPVREVVAVVVAVVVDDGRDPVPDDVDAALVVPGSIARVDDDPVLVVEAAELVVLEDHRRAPMDASVLGDVHRDPAPQAEVLVEVEDERVRVHDVSRPERDDGVARAFEHPALAGIGGQAGELACLPALAAVEARREAIRCVAAVGDATFLIDGDDVLRVRGVNRDRGLDLGVGLDVVLDRVGSRGRQGAELVRAGLDVTNQFRSRCRGVGAGRARCSDHQHHCRSDRETEGVSQAHRARRSRSRPSLTSSGWR